jgi:hypothetical protein
MIYKMMKETNIGRFSVIVCLIINRAILSYCYFFIFENGQLFKFEKTV